MGFLDSIDINEKYLLDNYPKILDLLLIDNTTKKNIIWATDSYKEKAIDSKIIFLHLSLVKRTLSNLVVKNQKLNKQRDLKIVQKYSHHLGCATNKII